MAPACMRGCRVPDKDLPLELVQRLPACFGNVAELQLSVDVTDQVLDVMLAGARHA